VSKNTADSSVVFYAKTTKRSRFGFTVSSKKGKTAGSLPAVF
jgi:hypothetical protein